MNTSTPDLSAPLADVQAQMGRVDTKGSMLIAGSLTAVSVGVAVIAKAPLPRPALTVAVVAVALIATAVILLITAVRPALGGNHGFVRWANTTSASALLEDLAKTDRETAVYEAQRLLSLSRAVYRKYRLIRLATDLLRAALALTAVAALLAAVV